MSGVTTRTYVESNSSFVSHDPLHSTIVNPDTNHCIIPPNHNCAGTVALITALYRTFSLLMFQQD